MFVVLNNSGISVCVRKACPPSSYKPQHNKRINRQIPTTFNKVSRAYSAYGRAPGRGLGVLWRMFFFRVCREHARAASKILTHFIARLRYQKWDGTRASILWEERAKGGTNSLGYPACRTKASVIRMCKLRWCVKKSVYMYAHSTNKYNINL